MTTFARRVANTAMLALLARHERRVPFQPAAQLHRRQRQRVRAIVEHAYATVPFYREAMRELRLVPADFRSADDLAALPLIDARIVRADTDRFLSSAVHATRRRQLASSGSHSGVRGLVWWDDASILRKLAYLERDRAVVGRLLGRDAGHQQLILLTSGSQSMLMRSWWDAWTITPRRLVRREQLSADVPYEEVADRLRALRPDIVYSYGSFADHFARWLAASGHRLQSPRVWCYGGDAMSPSGRETLERQTGALVYTTYQSTEMGRIGFECERRDGLHLNVDLCAMRIVDADGRTLPAGAEGEVILSNLHNRATVLLNYRMGDRGAMAEAACGCGRSLPVLRALLGRQTDVVRLADGRALSALVLATVCNIALATTLRSQLVCGAPGQVTWRVVLPPGEDVRAMEAAVRATVRAKFGDLLQASLEQVDELPSTPQGKFQRVLHAPSAVPLAAVTR